MGRDKRANGSKRPGAPDMGELWTLPRDGGRDERGERDEMGTQDRVAEQSGGWGCHGNRRGEEWRERKTGWRRQRTLRRRGRQQAAR